MSNFNACYAIAPCSSVLGGTLQINSEDKQKQRGCPYTKIFKLPKIFIKAKFRPARSPDKFM